MEIWKDIKGYEGIYEVSNLGRVKRYYLRNKKTKILKNAIVPSGYCYVSLSNRSVVSGKLVHRVMMESFYPIKDCILFDVNHKNGIKTDNRLENLEWCSRSENIIHSIKNSLTKTKLKKEDIPIIREMLKLNTHKKIAEIFGVSTHTINRISSKQSWIFV